jgi:hypothetical protein
MYLGCYVKQSCRVRLSSLVSVCTHMMGHSLWGYLRVPCLSTLALCASSHMAWFERMDLLVRS